MANIYIRVAVASPLSRVFDYSYPSSLAVPIRGARVCVPFGRKERVGIVLGVSKYTDVPADKIKAVISVLDPSPLLDEKILKLLLWASQYYAYPVGEVMSAALPAPLRQPISAAIPTEIHFRVVGKADPDSKLLNRSKLQRQVLMKLIAAPTSTMGAAQLAASFSGWRSAIKGLIDKGLVVSEEQEWRPQQNLACVVAPELNTEQQKAVDTVINCQDGFTPFLLNGVTGSGKTEVYLRLIEDVVRQGQQVLVLVPEISLTPQLLDRFNQRLSCTLSVLHSGMNDRQRSANWLAAARGHVDVVIGTRSAVFTPLPRLGLVVIDEEHDGSLKQQDRFRYHARDLALVRARDAGIRIVLGSATPSLESLHNLAMNRYLGLNLRHRAGNALPPKLGLLDIRRRKVSDGLSEPLLQAIERHRNRGGQALIFLNRRGYAPVLICENCGASADCKRCDAHMTVHAASNRLRCHHCGAERPLPSQCEACGSDQYDTVGQGTERIEEALNRHFPQAGIVRIDRDSTRRKGALEKQLAAAWSGEADILVGTQMLAKGHHFPAVTLVGILDADRGLFGTDFRSLEQMGQLITQVAGRSGRADRPGEVLIQTRNPDHRLLKLLIDEGYNTFAQEVLKERREAEFPPFSFVAIVRSESQSRQDSKTFLRYVADKINQLKAANPANASMMVLGPVVAPMEKIGGRYRYQLLLQATQRRALNQILTHIRLELETDKQARKVRWSIDVDPMDFY